MTQQFKMVVLAGLFLVSTAALCAEKSVKVSVDLVMVDVAVTKPDNSPVVDLKPENFQLFEDKVEQRIQYFSQETAPLSLGLIFDVSSSMDKKLDLARDAAIRFLKTGTPEDEYFLVEFSSRAQLSEDFTTDIGQLQSRLFLQRAQGATALYDAVYLGLSRVRAGQNPRKALLLITDGEDNHSRYSWSDLRAFVRESDVQIYVIDLGNALVNGLAEMTGGHSFHGSARDLDAICEKIAIEMKNQYVLGYASSNTNTDGKYRRIRVSTVSAPGEPKWSTRTREGYYR